MTPGHGLGQVSLSVPRMQAVLAGEHRCTRWESSSPSWDVTSLGQWCPLLGRQGLPGTGTQPPTHAAPQGRHTARSSHPARASHPSVLPCCHSGSKWDFIASCFATAAGTGRGRALAGRVPPSAGRTGRAGPGRGGSSARSHKKPLTPAFFMLCITRTWFIPRKEARQKHAIKMLRWPLQREALGLRQADASN